MKLYTELLDCLYMYDRLALQLPLHNSFSFRKGFVFIGLQYFFLLEKYLLAVKYVFILAFDHESLETYKTPLRCSKSISEQSY